MVVGGVSSFRVCFLVWLWSGGGGLLFDWLVVWGLGLDGLTGGYCVCDWLWIALGDCCVVGRCVIF